MSKMSEEMEKRNWAALEELVNTRDAIAMEVMREVFARLPYGQKFTLSDGSVGYLRKLAEPQLCSNESSHYFECPHFGVDVVIEGGKVDHIEISAFQTGARMAIGPTDAVNRASANSPKADETGTAQPPENSPNWTASQGRHSTSPARRTRRERGDGGGGVQC
jgi:hypothetical protein